MCSICVWPYHRVWGVLFFMTAGYGICNVRTHLGGVPFTRRGVRHNQVCTRVDSEGQKKCLSPSPARGSNPGSSDLNSDSLSTELRPRSVSRIFCYVNELVLSSQQGLTLNWPKAMLRLKSTKQQNCDLEMHKARYIYMYIIIVLASVCVGDSVIILVLECIGAYLLAITPVDPRSDDRIHCSWLKKLTPGWCNYDGVTGWLNW